MSGKREEVAKAAYETARDELQRLGHSYRLMATAHVDDGRRAMSINPSRFFDVANAIESLVAAEENLEGYLCPEDVGWPEYIEALARQLRELQQAAREYRAASERRAKAQHAYMDLRLDGDATSWESRRRLTVSERTALELEAADANLAALLPAPEPETTKPARKPHERERDTSQGSW